MVNKFEKLFRVNRETTSPAEIGETIPIELKRRAVEAVVTANIAEPLSFQLGAVKMADIILESEQLGLSRYWMFSLSKEDVAEIEEIMFNFKNKVHAQHNITSNPETVRVQEKMYDLFKSYGDRGDELLVSVEHHLGHILNTGDIRDMLQWIEKRRTKMSTESAEYREMQKAGERLKAQRMLMGMYKKLYTDFLQSDLHTEKSFKIKSFYSHMSGRGDFYVGEFNMALRSLFLGTFYND